MDARALKARAAELGFDACGIARAGPADPEGRLRDWLARERHGPMDYMARNVAEREDVERVVPGARSVVALAMSYRREAPPRGPLKVSRYVTARDYHKVLRKRLRKLRKSILEAFPEAAVKPSVDTSPVLERAWAARAGIAWIGKSCMAISPRLGTYSFLGTLITDVGFEADEPMPDRCGSCTRCLDACPTQAFVGPRELDARRCITTWNVEERTRGVEALPELHGWLAGCDVCQEVCPWNKFGVEADPELEAQSELSWPTIQACVQDPERLEALIRGTALQRTGASALRRNALRILR
ncbi:MAG: tRNA epoxyqueuosine(34) reductase QueG [Myxococcota bacterium]